jgi:RecA-family ATPase
MIVPMWGKENVLLAKLDKSGQVKPTTLYQELCKLIEEFEPTLVIMANRVNIFSVNQNDDVHARQCLALLDAIVKNYQCTVIMPGHPSLGQLASGSGSSGSVQWSNGCRHRLYLSRPKKNNSAEDSPSEDDRDKRILEVMKANWGPQGVGLMLRWTDWFFQADDEDLMLQPEPGETPAEAKKRAHEEQVANAEHEFLRMLDRATAQGIALSAQPTSRTNAATMFARNAAFSDCHFRGDLGYRILVQAMTNLFKKGTIKTVPFGPKSYGKFCIVRAKK